MIALKGLSFTYIFFMCVCVCVRTHMGGGVDVSPVLVLHLCLGDMDLKLSSFPSYIFPCMVVWDIVSHFLVWSL